MENGKVEAALAKFRKPYNCAQTVYAAFKPDDSDGIAELASCGGGRAPDGLCGALFAAEKLCPDSADSIAAEFSEKVGAKCCREIKTVHKTPCEKCVEAAARAACAKLG